MPSAAETATLLVHCPDRRGIVAALAQLLYGHGANILDADQHTDLVSGQFFQRVRFDLAELHTDRLALEHAIRETAERFAMRWRIAYSAHRKRVAIFVSRYDHCLYDLLLRHRAGELPCEMALVREQPPGPRGRGRPVRRPLPAVSDRARDQGRAGAPRARAAARRSHRPAWCSPATCRCSPATSSRSYLGRIINIHHSFLPAFMGGRPYHQAAERGVKLIGATAHYATTDLDEGPIIEQDVIRTSHRDAVADLVRKGRDVERAVLARAVRWHLEDRILVYGNKTVVFE